MLLGPEDGFDESVVVNNPALYKSLRDDVMPIFKALHTGDLEKVKAAFKQINKKGISWGDLEKQIYDVDDDIILSTYLLQACAVGSNINVLKYLLRNQNFPFDARCSPAFLTAANSGNLELVTNFLLTHHVSTNTKLLIESYFRAFANQHQDVLAHIKLIMSLGLNYGDKVEQVIQELESEIETFTTEYETLKEIGSLVIKVRREKLNELIPVIQSSEDLSAGLSNHVAELKNLIELSQALSNASSTISNPVFALYAQNVVADMQAWLETDDAQKAPTETKAILDKGLQEIHYFWSEDFEQEIDEKTRKSKSYRIILESSSKIYDSLFETLPKMYQVIKLGKVEALKSLFQNQDIAMQLHKQDKLISSTLIELGKGFFTSTVCGLIGTYGRQDMYQILKQAQWQIEIEELNGIILQAAIESGQVDFVGELLKEPQFKESSALLEAYSMACSAEDQTIRAMIKRAIEQQEIFDEDAKVVARLDRHAEFLAQASKMTLQTAFDNYKEAHEIVVDACRVFSEFKQLIDLNNIAPKLSALSSIKLEEYKQIINRQAGEDITLNPQIIFYAKIIILNIYDAFEKKYVEDAASVEKLAQVREQLERLVDILDVQSKAASVVEVVSQNLPAEIQTDALRRAGEDAMDKPNSDEIGFYHELQKQYKQAFEQRGGVIPILDDLRQYLVEQFQAQGLSKQKPSGDDSQQKSYYTNIYHTAWRYISGKNPWISKTAQYAKGDEANIMPKDFEMIAYFWLAASDEQTPCINGITHKDRKDHYIRELALLNREHNWDNTRPVESKDDEGLMQIRYEYYDDLKADSPSCTEGVQKRAFQLVFGHPVLNKMKPLNPNLMLQRFKEQCITSGLFERLEELESSDIDALYQAIYNKIILMEDIDEASKQHLQIDLADFIERCVEDYGDPRLNTVPVYFQGIKHDNYLCFVNDMAEKPMYYFGDILFEKVKSLLTTKHVEEQPQPLVHAFNLSRGSAGVENTEDADKKKKQSLIM